MSDTNVHIPAHAVSAPPGRSVDDASLDEHFDRLFPDRIRRLSRIHWTPLAVARQVLTLLNPQPHELVLDVGAGAGKFCLFGALNSSARFVGIEERGDLVQVSRTMAERLGANTAEFLHGDALVHDWTPYTMLYLYNPFEERKFAPALRIDDALSVGAPSPEGCAEKVRQKLVEMRPGTRAVLYHGFGGELPGGYARTWSGFFGSGTLELWVKRS